MQPADNQFMIRTAVFPLFNGQICLSSHSGRILYGIGTVRHQNRLLIRFNGIFQSLNINDTVSAGNTSLQCLTLLCVGVGKIIVFTVGRLCIQLFHGLCAVFSALQAVDSLIRGNLNLAKLFSFYGNLPSEVCFFDCLPHLFRIVPEILRKLCKLLLCIRFFSEPHSRLESVTIASLLQEGL